jgi:hypothetical protein
MNVAPPVECAGASRFPAVSDVPRTLGAPDVPDVTPGPDAVVRYQPAGRRAPTPLVVALVACVACALAVLWPAGSAAAQAAPAGFADGDLLQVAGDDKIHLVHEGQRHWIADTQSLQRLNPDFTRLRQIGFDDLSRVPAGRPLHAGPVIRDSATGRVYLLTQETTWPEPRKHWIDDLDSFSRLGFTWEDVSVDWPRSPDAYGDAPALTFRPVSRDPATVQTTAGTLTAVPFWRLQVDDERLFAALALAQTYGAEWRAQVAPHLATKGTWITWGALPEEAGGYFDVRRNRITINASLSGEGPGVLATILAHETLHAVTEHGSTSESCIQEEASAFVLEAQTWASLPAQYREGSSSDVETQRLIAAFWQRHGLPGMVELVASNPAYQRECGSIGQ